MKEVAYKRRFPAGAEPQASGGVHFRVWAPAHKKVDLVIESGPGHRPGKPVFVPLSGEDDGYFSAFVEETADGTSYRFRLGGKDTHPDPVSRAQPHGIDGPSLVVDPGQFSWTDQKWQGCPAKGRVVYEMHVGTFTPEGTWTSAIKQLPALADIGINVLEVMPIAEFAGEFGWGYDGVFLFAPTRLYGKPHDFRRFVDAAHALGLAVILDVVYNHLGPEGNCLERYSKDYFSERYSTDWGKAVNFDGRNAGPVRDFYVANAGYWIEEYHLDGLRLDATQNIYDSSERHILADIATEVRTRAGKRGTFIVAENETQLTRLVRPQAEGGYGLDALWNDDFHHSARVAMTGRTEAYYHDYRGTPHELLAAVKWGYLYQGQMYYWQKKRRGTPALDLTAGNFISFIENHDQIANSSFGKRVHQLTSPSLHRAMTALLLLAPSTPMLFQGQEYSAPQTFQYFADFSGKLGESVRNGRFEFLSQFRTLAGKSAQKALADPTRRETFTKSRLDPSRDRAARPEVVKLHKDLLTLRRQDSVFSREDSRRMHGSLIDSQILLLRFVGDQGDDRLFILNLRQDFDLKPAPEPLLAPPADRQWRLIWSSEAAEYGGTGEVPFDCVTEVRVPGRCAMVLKAVSGEEEEEHER